MSRCDHDVVPGRKEGTERCRKCSWRFPCLEDNCAHMDCIEFKRQLPKCYYCGERVQGPPAGVTLPGSSYPVLAENAGPDASWTPWNVRGHTRAVHYCCRDACAGVDELARWELNPKDVGCVHPFDGKLRPV